MPRALRKDKGIPKRPLFSRIRERIAFDPATGCWNWTGTRNGQRNCGYAVIETCGRKRLVHLVMYEALKGPLPTGLEADHRCWNKRCVNPNHIEAVTHAENIRRMHQAYPRTACVNGHEYTPNNTTVLNGNRACVICYRARVRRQTAKRAQP